MMSRLNKNPSLTQVCSLIAFPECTAPLNIPQVQACSILATGTLSPSLEAGSVGLPQLGADRPRRVGAVGPTFPVLGRVRKTIKNIVFRGNTVLQVKGT